MLIGTYQWNNQLYLDITEEPINGVVKGVFRNVNPGQNWSCPVSGVFQPWDAHHNRILLSLSGTFMRQPDPSSQPAIRYSVISVYGYSETSDATSPIQTLTLIQGWAEDARGHSNATIGSQSPMPFIRQ